ncbi:MAG: hypothetical protein P9L92_05960 [Candidatus Electryonea clarkiae]|nr:hypothetical protein [Candidatus Electryonea clarkiae]MDP8288785.1 hypothetical protein [Candidatus Electryonea clarkiae]
MSEERYELAGWLTVASVGLMILGSGLGVVQTLIGYSNMILVPVLAITTIIQTSFSVYAVIWFRRLLNRRFDFHAVDTLITLLIIAQVLLTFVSIYLRSLPMAAMDGHMEKKEALALIIPALITLCSVAFPMAIVGIVFGIRILRLNDTLFGYLKPLAYTQIIGSSLILTFFLAPIGGLVLMAGEIFQALILIQSARELPEPEFV